MATLSEIDRASSWSCVRELFNRGRGAGLRTPSGTPCTRRYESLSVTDAIIVAAMQREEIDYRYCFDGGFDSVSALTRLTTPDNPFEQ